MEQHYVTIKHKIRMEYLYWTSIIQHFKHSITTNCRLVTMSLAVTEYIGVYGNVQCQHSSWRQKKVVSFFLSLWLGWKTYNFIVFRIQKVCLCAVRGYFSRLTTERIVEGLLEYLRRRWFQQIICPFACVASTHHLFAVSQLSVNQC